MNGSAVKSARQSFNGSEPNVLIDFIPQAASSSRRSPASLWLRGSLMKQSQTFAIVLDTVIESDPHDRLHGLVAEDGISGGAEIRGGNMTVSEAQDLALVLNIGALPAKLEPSLPAAGLGHAGQGLAATRPSSPASPASASCSSTCSSTTASWA